MSETDADLKAEKLERPRRVRGGTAEGTGNARQADTPSDEHSGQPLPVTMEEVLSRPNMLAAYHRVMSNKGAPGVDGVTVLQVLTPLFEPTFSETSFGFRPGCSAHQALDRAKEHIAAVLMARLARRIEDKRILKLIRRYLQAGLMEGGVVSPRNEGTPQGLVSSPFQLFVQLVEQDVGEQRRERAASRAGCGTSSGITGSPRYGSRSKNSTSGSAVSCGPFCGASGSGTGHGRRASYLSRSVWYVETKPPYTDPFVRWCGTGGALSFLPD